MHGTTSQGLLKRFKVLKKCRNKSDCLVYEIRFIRRALKPNLDVQSDSFRAEVIVNSSSQNRFKCCNLHDLIYIFFDNGVMTTTSETSDFIVCFYNFMFYEISFNKNRLLIN